AEEALAARRPLRAHGLVTVSGPSGGHAEPAAAVSPAPGLAARLAGVPTAPDELAPGIEVVHARSRPTLPHGLAWALRDHLVDVEPGWVTMRGIRPGDAHLLAEALSFRLARFAVVVDARAIVAQGQAWDLLAALRRESDLTDTPLLIDGPL